MLVVLGGRWLVLVVVGCSQTNLALAGEVELRGWLLRRPSALLLGQFTCKLRDKVLIDVQKPGPFTCLTSKVRVLG